jgi:hypothetical protein
VNDTTPQLDRSRSNRSRRGRTLAVAAVGLASMGTLACTAPAGPGPLPTTAPTKPGPSPTLPPPRGDCQIIDFKTATVSQRPSPATTPRYLLTVTGTVASRSQTVRLVPVTYIQQPVYWAIEVTACAPQIGLPATDEFTAELDLTGTIGTKGIQVVGASRSETIDVG